MSRLSRPASGVARAIDVILDGLLASLAVIVVLFFCLALFSCSKQTFDKVNPYVCPNHSLDCTCFSATYHEGCSDNWYQDIYEPWNPSPWPNSLAAPCNPDAGPDAACTNVQPTPTSDAGTK